MSYVSDTKFFEERTRLKLKCKHCGHTQAIDNSQDKIICKWCKNYIFRNDDIEEKYRFREKLFRERRKIYELI